jgi:hypothetical protein
MTGLSKETRSLPLQGSPRSRFKQLVALALGVPAAIIIGVFGYAYSRGAPATPLLVSGAVALAITVAATMWIAGMIRRIAVTLDGDALTVTTGIATRRFPLATLRGHGLRSVNLAEHMELRPILRAWGIGMPGLASGWFLLRNRAKALCILTGRERVTALCADDGTWLLLSLVDPAPLREALAGDK